MSAARTSSGLPRPLLGLFAVVFVSKLAVLLWGASRGLEMGDEGFFLMNLNRPEESPPFFEFYKLLSWLGTPQFGVVSARLLRIATELAATLVLTWNVFHWARARVPACTEARFTPFLLFCLAGALISVASRSFSYNDVTNLCTFVAVGCLFQLAACGEDPRATWRRGLAALGAGFFIGFQLAVKFPTALLLFGLATAAVALLFDGLSRGQRFRLVALQAAGATVAALLFVATNGGWSPLVDAFQRGMEGARLSGYDPIEILGRYAAVESWTLLNAAVLATACFGSRSLLRRIGVRPGSAAVGGWVLAAIALAATTASLPLPFLHPSLVFFASLVWTSLLVLWVQARRQGPAEATGAKSRARLAPLGLLVALPLVAVAGSNVPITMRLPSHALPLFAAIGVLLARSGCDGHRRLERGALAALLLGASTMVFVQHPVLRPYGLPQPLYRQKHPVAGLEGVRVDRATAAFLERVAKEMTEAGFRAGDPVVAFDYMPGLVHYLGGRSPGFPFYWRDRPQLNCRYLNAAGLSKPPFLVMGKALSDEQRACLDAFSFPDEFVLIDAPTYPYEGVYEGFGLAGLSRVYLYGARP